MNAERNAMQTQERERKNAKEKRVTKTELKCGVETENEGRRILVYSKVKVALKYRKCVQEKQSMYIKLMNGI